MIASARFEVPEATIPELQAAMSSGRVTAVEIVDAYLARVAAYDQKGPHLNAMIRMNPSARAEAASRDAERRAGRVRGPLHGVPVIIKDNFGTVGMPTAVNDAISLREPERSDLLAGHLYLTLFTRHEPNGLARAVLNISPAER